MAVCVKRLLFPCVHVRLGRAGAATYSSIRRLPGTRWVPGTGWISARQSGTRLSARPVDTAASRDPDRRVARQGPVRPGEHHRKSPDFGSRRKIKLRLRTLQPTRPAALGTSPKFPVPGLWVSTPTEKSSWSSAMVLVRGVGCEADARKCVSCRHPRRPGSGQFS